jgi:hypothetical protein
MEWSARIERMQIEQQISCGSEMWLLAASKTRKTVLRGVGYFVTSLVT